MSDLKTSFDFQTGYDAASKAKQVIMDAQEAEIARLQGEVYRYELILKDLPTIEKATAEIARLQNELDKAHRLCSQMIGWQHNAEIISAKLREALMEICTMQGEPIQIARKALAKKET